MPGVKILALLCLVGILVVAVLTSIVAVAVSANPSPGPLIKKDVPPVARPQTLDDLHLEIAETIPEYGGAFLKGGKLLVYLQSGHLPDAEVEQAVEASLGPDSDQVDGMEVLLGQYNYTQLTDWYEKTRHDALEIMDVVYTDINEATNRIEVGVANQAAESAVAKLLPKLGVPAQAVTFQQTEPIVIEPLPWEGVEGVGLQGMQRPLVGGIQINFNSSTVCTLGFIAIRAGVPWIPGLVTASHCTATQGGVESTNYNQLLNLTSELVGVELVDPLLFDRQANPACPRKKVCRYSDSAFVQVPHPSGPDVGIGQGEIAKPIAGTTNWDLITKYRIVGEPPTHPLSGETLFKVGRTTGQTQGPVSNTSNTCVDANVGADKTMLCQWKMDAGVNGGDSGAPVLRLTADPLEVSLYGVVWGRNTAGTQIYFSELASVQSELGPLDNCVSGVSGIVC